MSKQYTITGERAFSDIDGDGVKITGVVYSVVLQDGDYSESQDYFVRDGEVKENVLDAAIGLFSAP